MIIMGEHILLLVALIVLSVILPRLFERKIIGPIHIPGARKKESVIEDHHENEVAEDWAIYYEDGTVDYLTRWK